MTNKERSEQSGRIELNDGMIRYTSAFFGSWQLPASKVRVCGEYTTDNGPMIDDWFMVFVPDEGNGWYEASVYATGADLFLTGLAKVFGAESLYGELFASTEFASRVIWPSHLRDMPLFEFRSVPMPWWKRLIRLGSGQIRFALSPEVQAFVARPV